MADHDILDQIDDVITWHGSRDAMVWTADKPKQSVASPELARVLNQLRPDPEATRRAHAQFAAQFSAVVEAFRPIVESVLHMARAFASIVNSPGMRDLTQEQRRARSAMKSEYNRRRRARGRRR